jgi:hypothetical protein
LKISVTTSDKKSAAIAKFMANARKVSGSYVSVGFHGGAGNYEDGTDVVEVALWNEFGTRTSPERSFIRSAIDANLDKINKWREEGLNNMLTKGWTMEKALDMLGFRLQTLIQNKIKSNVPPPNADSTVAQKKRDGVAPNTLIHTELMLRSVTYRVVIK